MDSRTGEIITAHQAENGVLIWTINNPLFFKTQQEIWTSSSKGKVIDIQIRFNHNLRKALGIHICFLNFRIWTISRPPTGLFLTAFRKQVYKYLNTLGVISLNNVIRAVNHVLWNVLKTTIEVDSSTYIKFNIY
ncbi:replication enhancement protein ReN [Hollyhock leaf crumple virus-[Cairo]]|uniref:Replication enhancer n=1 Tax=Hollyhock leaf crumple virus-[Cairo] TaxID=223279 RepID=Q8V0I3_9GEMI|nr:replication enhancement protein ReN [Hollyhock leaf crumple virus]AAK64551.1 replication enhancement protein ReN [Hollyhock leaf crumple virus-[Cairo]]